MICQIHKLDVPDTGECPMICHDCDRSMIVPIRELYKQNVLEKHPDPIEAILNELYKIRTLIHNKDNASPYTKIFYRDEYKEKTSKTKNKDR